MDRPPVLSPVVVQAEKVGLENMKEAKILLLLLVVLLTLFAVAKFQQTSPQTTMQSPPSAPPNPTGQPGRADPVLLAKIVAAQEKAKLEAVTQKARAASKKQRDLIKSAQSKAKNEAKLQPKRKQFIQKLISQGVFSKVEMPGSLPHLWVKPVFYSLDYETKEQFVNVVYAYYVTENPRWDIIVLKDSRTGKRIGSYSEFGLDLN